MLTEALRRERQVDEVVVPKLRVLTGVVLSLVFGRRLGRRPVVGLEGDLYVDSLTGTKEVKGFVL